MTLEHSTKNKQWLVEIFTNKSLNKLLGSFLYKQLQYQMNLLQQTPC